MVKIEIKDVRLVPVSEIKRNPKNRNKHPNEQIEELARHYEVHGMRTPLIVSNQSGQIVAGDGRFQAALKAKMKEVPVSYQDFDSPEMERAFGVADNGLSLWSELDLIGIQEDWKDAPVDFNLNDLGIKDFKLVDTEVLEPGCDEDSVPEFVEPKTKPGDLYKLGNHRLLCGDSTSATDFEKLMGGARADISFTSPPYNVGQNGNMKGNEVGKKYLTASDDKTESEYLDFLSGNLNLLLMHSSEVFYNIQLLGANKSVLAELLFNYKTMLKDLIYWVKANAAPHIEPGIMSSYVEWIICLSKDNNTKKFQKTNAPRGSLKNIIQGPGNGQNEYSKIHSATFPVYLAESVIKDFTQEGMSVIDSFGGTGTTMIAAEKLKRIAFLMELDPKYCDVIVARWEKYTGQKAELISG